MAWVMNTWKILHFKKRARPEFPKVGFLSLYENIATNHIKQVVAYLNKQFGDEKPITDLIDKNVD